MDPNTDAQEHERMRELFGYGRAGEPVAQVDPADVRAVWEITQKSVKDRPEGGSIIGREIFRRACKHGANVAAVVYRAQRIGMFQLILPDVIGPLLQDKLDAVFQAAATIPMEWIGQGVHHGWTFDPDEFLRRVREAA